MNLTDRSNSTNLTRPVATSTSAKATFSIEVTYAYAVIGTGGILANLFILLVLLSDRKLLKQSANMVGIAISHLFCAVAIGVAGYYRLVWYDYLALPATSWSCAMLVFPALQPISFQCMGVMLVLVGTERFCVFAFPNWYRTKWTNTRNWQIVGLIFGGIAIALSVGLYRSWYGAMMTVSCGYQAVLSREFFTYGMWVSCVGGSSTVVLTLIGLVRGTLHTKKLPLLSGEAGRHRRQLKLSQSMLTVALCDFCLVVMPSFVYILSTIYPELFPALVFANISNFTNLTYCANTMTSLVSYVIFHRQFRAIASKLLSAPHRFGKVAPASGGKQNPPTSGNHHTMAEVRFVSVRTSRTDH